MAYGVTQWRSDNTSLQPVDVVAVVDVVEHVHQLRASKQRQHACVVTSENLETSG